LALNEIKAKGGGEEERKLHIESEKKVLPNKKNKWGEEALRVRNDIPKRWRGGGGGTREKESRKRQKKNGKSLRSGAAIWKRRKKGRKHGRTRGFLGESRFNNKGGIGGLELKGRKRSVEAFLWVGAQRGSRGGKQTFRRKGNPRGPASRGR